MIISPIIYEDYNSIIGHILFKNVLTIYFDNNFGSGVVKYNDDELKQTVENFCLKIFNRTYGFKTLQKLIGSSANQIMLPIFLVSHIPSSSIRRTAINR